VVNRCHTRCRTGGEGLDGRDATAAGAAPTRPSADRAYVIRPADARDALGLCQLTATIATEHIFIVPDQLFFTPAQQEAVLEGRDPHRHQVWVAVLGTQVVAELEVVRGVWPKTQHTATMAVVVDPDHRGRGLLRHTLPWAQQWAKEEGVDKLCLTVFATNTVARAAYRRLGFWEEGVRRGQYLIANQLVDEVMMAQWMRDVPVVEPLVSRILVDRVQHTP